MRMRREVRAPEPSGCDIRKITAIAEPTAHIEYIGRDYINMQTYIRTVSNLCALYRRLIMFSATQKQITSESSYKG